MRQRASKRDGGLLVRGIFHAQTTDDEKAALVAFYGKPLDKITTTETVIFLIRRGAFFYPGGRRAGWGRPKFKPEDVDGSV